MGFAGEGVADFKNKYWYIHIEMARTRTIAQLKEEQSDEKRYGNSTRRTRCA